MRCGETWGEWGNEMQYGVGWGGGGVRVEMLSPPALSISPHRVGSHLEEEFAVKVPSHETVRLAGLVLEAECTHRSPLQKKKPQKETSVL